MKKLLNETIIYGIGAILPRVITFLLNPLYIHYIDKEAFSVFSSLYSWIALVNVMLTFGFETSFFRFSTEKENEKMSFDTSFWFIFGLASVFLISILMFSAPLSVILDYAKNPEFLRWFAMIAFLDAICVIPFAWLRFHNMPIKYSVIRVASIFVQTVSVIALFIFVPTSTSKKLGLDGQVSYPFISNLLGSLATFVLLLPIILKVKFRFSKELFSRMIKYSWPIMIAGLAFQVNENYDKITQYYNISKADAGAYGGCYKLAVLMTLFVTAYRMGIEPYFFKQMNNENAKNNYAKVTEYFSFFASIVAMGIIANISWLKVIFITDHSYWTAMDIVPIIVIANLCFGIYYNLSTWYKVTDKTYFGTLISWFGAGVTIVLHLLFLQKYGFMVSAWVTFIAYFLMMVLSYFLGQKYYPIPYRIKKISFFLVLLMVFSFISVKYFNYNVWLSNILFFIYSGILLYSEKQFILSKIKK
ncbi:lipopolysaccharide biosynthesis protein [Cloacibacterium sp.]|uniref:lipopolysaccharide biosynthesis protein n=1 Tax=Cloacibacterium sp. TaxID=1913682 RepID=UPI0039E5176F